MAAILVSAKDSVFYSMIIKTSPKSSPKSSQNWHKHYLKHKTTYNQRLEQIFIPKQKQKAKKTKNKIGLPPNKRYRLTPLAKHR